MLFFNGWLPLNCTRKHHFLHSRIGTLFRPRPCSKIARAELSLWKQPPPPVATGPPGHSTAPLCEGYSSAATVNLTSRICFNKVSSASTGLGFVLPARTGILLKAPADGERSGVCFSTPRVFVWIAFQYNISPCLSWHIVPASVRNRCLERSLKGANRDASRAGGGV